MVPLRLAPLLLAVAAQAAPLKVTLGPDGPNPIALVGKPGDVAGSANALGGCTLGLGASIANEPLVELTLKQPTQELVVRSSKPWAMIFSDGTIECSTDDHHTVNGTVPAGVARLYALGQSAHGTGLSLGYVRGERVSVHFEAHDWPLRFDLSGATTLKVGAEPQEQPLAIALKAPQPSETRVHLDVCDFWGPKPDVVLELAPLRAAHLFVGFARERPGFALVGPLDAPRAEQKVRCSSDFTLAKDEFLEGRYALFGMPETKTPQRVLLAGPKTQDPATFRTSAAEDLKDLPLEERVLHKHYPFFPLSAVELQHPADFEIVAALWRAVRAQLLVTPRVELTPDLLQNSALTVAQGEPLLLLGVGSSEAEVLTLDGERVKVSPKFLLAQAPSSVVAPHALRGADRINPDDDLGFEFVTDTLKGEHDRFKKLDEKADTCWRKNYNPKGQDYDVVTYRNGEIVNVESLDARFRNKAMKACKRDLDAAEKAGKALRGKLATERKKRWETLLGDAKTAVGSSIAAK